MMKVREALFLAAIILFPAGWPLAVAQTIIERDATVSPTTTETTSGTTSGTTTEPTQSYQLKTSTQIETAPDLLKTPPQLERQTTQPDDQQLLNTKTQQLENQVQSDQLLPTMTQGDQLQGAATEVEQKAVCKYLKKEKDLLNKDDLGILPESTTWEQIKASGYDYRGVLSDIGFLENRCLAPKLLQRYSCEPTHKKAAETNGVFYELKICNDSCSHNTCHDTPYQYTLKPNSPDASWVTNIVASANASDAEWYDTYDDFYKYFVGKEATDIYAMFFQNGCDKFVCPKFPVNGTTKVALSRCVTKDIDHPEAGTHCAIMCVAHSECPHGEINTYGDQMECRVPTQAEAYIGLGDNPPKLCMKKRTPSW